MRKLFLLLLVTLLFTSCYTPTVDQTELYGSVESILRYGGHNHVKVWCNAKGRYYEVVTDKLYQKGEIIKIK